MKRHIITNHARGYAMKDDLTPTVYRNRNLAEVPKKGIFGTLTEEQAAAFVRRENRFSIIRPGKHSKHFWAFRIIHT